MKKPKKRKKLTNYREFTINAELWPGDQWQSNQIFKLRSLKQAKALVELLQMTKMKYIKQGF